MLCSDTRSRFLLQWRRKSGEPRCRVHQVLRISMTSQLRSKFWMLRCGGFVDSLTLLTPPSPPLPSHREITAELDRLTIMLAKLHSKMAGKFDEVSYHNLHTYVTLALRSNNYFHFWFGNLISQQRNEVTWEVQRAITDLRRKVTSLSD